MDQSGHPNHRTTLAIIVNYHSARMCLDAVSSICAADAVGPVQVVVVDNSVEDEEARMLALGLPAGVSLIVNPENHGFAAACNQALAEYHPDMIFLLNPDAVVDPDGLIRMQRCLMADARIGAVGPQIFWDPKRRFLLPPSLPPELMRIQQVLAPYAGLSRLLSLLWRRYALRVWRGVGPLRVWNLSGGHVLLDARAVRRAGGLFDERFFLYYEDSDLFWRLRKVGYRLMVEPRAVVVHGFDRCDRGGLPQKRRWMQESGRRFWEKHGPGMAGRIYPNGKMDRMLRYCQRAADRLCSGMLPAETTLSQNPLFRGPFSMDVPPKLSSGWLFEWSPNENFLPAAGCFGTASTLNFSAEDVALLSPGMYAARIGSDRAWLPETTTFRMIKDR
ncbi:MAG: glycosyltransferase [Thermodesulfobacteriota bacterium]